MPWPVSQTVRYAIGSAVHVVVDQHGDIYTGERTNAAADVGRRREQFVSDSAHQLRGAFDVGQRAAKRVRAGHAAPFSLANAAAPACRVAAFRSASRPLATSPPETVKSPHDTGRIPLGGSPPDRLDCRLSPARGEPAGDGARGAR